MKYSYTTIINMIRNKLTRLKNKMEKGITKSKGKRINKNTNKAKIKIKVMIKIKIKRCTHMTLTVC